MVSGRRSGRLRLVPLAVFPYHRGYYVVASYFGRRHRPTWYFDLKRAGSVRLYHGGTLADFSVREAADEERDGLWARAVAIYPGYAQYEARAGVGPVPILMLLPPGANGSPLVENGFVGPERDRLID